VHGLALLSQYLSSQQRSALFCEVLETESRAERSQLLALMAPYLSSLEMAEALSSLMTVGDEAARVDAMISLAGRFEGSERSDILLEALRITGSIPNGHRRAEVLLRLAGHLPSDFLDLARDVATEIPNRSARDQALLGLMELRRRSPLREQTGSAVRMFSALAEVAHSAFRQIGETEERVAALVARPASLSPEQLSEVISFVRAQRGSLDRGAAIEAIAPYLSTSQLREAVSVANNDHSKYRGKALVACVPRLPERDRHQFLEELLCDTGFEDRAQFMRALTVFFASVSSPNLRVARKHISEVTAWFP
jgi:hypothetical protein